MTEPEFMTKQQAAEWLGISERMLTDMVTDRAIPFRRHSERNIRFHVEDLRRWSESRKVEEQGDAGYSV